MAAHDSSVPDTAPCMESDRKLSASTDPPDPLCQASPEQTLRLDRESVDRYRRRTRRGSLLVIDGFAADIGFHQVCNASVEIGREPEQREDVAVLCLRDGGSSRRHAAVERRDDAYFVRDLGSTNGTLLNGELVSEARELREGDIICVGQSLIKFLLVDDTEATYHNRMDRLAGTDMLTGLPAKHRFDSLLNDAFRNARQQKTPLSAMMIDLDGLKAINDRHGHHVGAHTIGQIGRRIGELLEGYGECCRFGGDEFSAFFPGRSCSRAALLAEQVRLDIQKMDVSLNDITVSVTMSIGVAELEDGMLNAQALLQRADEALYRAKSQGKNRVVS